MHVVEGRRVTVRKRPPLIRPKDQWLRHLEPVLDGEKDEDRDSPRNKEHLPRSVKPSDLGRTFKENI
jgi:hypothetical protein